MSQDGKFDLRPRFSPPCFKADLEAFFDCINCAEDFGTGVRAFCGRTRLFALDFAERRDLLEFVLANGF